MGKCIIWPAVSCCMAAPGHEPFGCVCPTEEKALRGWMRSDAAMPAMTTEQREYCLQEIGRVEGYDRSEWEDSTDKDLARGVISAWTDYCRDKGLL